MGLSGVILSDLKWRRSRYFLILEIYIKRVMLKAVKTEWSQKSAYLDIWMSNILDCKISY